MASPFPIVGYAAREQLLSSDVMRTEKLASKMLQEEMRLESVDDSGTPVNAFTRVPALTKNAGVFTIDVGPGEALVISSSGVTADDSNYQVLGWPATQTLTFGTPDGVNPRIDLIVAPLANVSSDVAVRNILVDPNTRTIVPTPVPKTFGPGATLAVVAGTPAGSPVPPAVPANNFALFEVYVPAAAADAVAFKTVQRLWRRAPYPWAGLSGVVSGVDLRWTQVNPAATDSVLSLSLNTARRHRVLIDGELLDFTGITQVFSDLGGNNPFGSAAPAATDKPYFIYLVGGRHAPQGWFQTPSFAPVALVESLVQPDQTTGRPSAGVRDPRTGGTTIAGAVYVGLGWVYRNTTHRRPVMVSGNWAFAAGGSFESPAATTLTGTPFSFPPLASCPVVGSTLGSIAGVICELRGTGVTSIHEIFVSPTVASPEGDVTHGAPLVMNNGTPTAGQARLWFDPNVGAIFNVYQGLNNDALSILPAAYMINAIRYDGQAFSA